MSTIFELLNIDRGTLPIDQAIESVTRLPLDQSLGFQKIGFDLLLSNIPPQEWVT